jgi:uncharacterized protein YdcH (DUF465 family)
MFPIMILFLICIFIIGFIAFLKLKKSYKVDKILTDLFDEENTVDATIKNYEKGIKTLKDLKKDNTKTAEKITAENSKIDKIVK